MQMTYVVYNIETTKIVGSRNTRTWRTEAAAKAHLTRMTKLGYRAEDHAVQDTQAYHMLIEESVERVNLMSGQTYRESVNTPLCCSPASETYWSI
jgi:hypothetical protein